MKPLDQEHFQSVKEMYSRRASAQSFYKLTILAPVTPWTPFSSTVHRCPAVLIYTEMCFLKIIYGFMYIQLLVIYLGVFLVMDNSQNILKSWTSFLLNQRAL